MFVFPGEVDGVGRSVGDGVLTLDADIDTDSVVVGAKDSEGVLGSVEDDEPDIVTEGVDVGSSDLVWGRDNVWV